MKLYCTYSKRYEKKEVTREEIQDILSDLNSTLDRYYDIIDENLEREDLDQEELQEKKDDNQEDYERVYGKFLEIESEVRKFLKNYDNGIFQESISCDLSVVWEGSAHVEERIALTMEEENQDEEDQE